MEEKVINADDNEIYKIKIRELEPVEIKFSEEASNITGYIMIGNQQRDLPIGSKVNTKNGIFHWIPGPGFLGEYRFVFVEKDKNGNWYKKYIKINVIPKYLIEK